MKNNILLLLLLLSCQGTEFKTSDSSIENRLKKFISNTIKINEEISFSNPEDSLHEIKAIYIGTIKTASNSFKILNVINYTGILKDSRRANAKIFIYEKNNKLLGKYALGSIDDLPEKINSQESLIFNPPKPCDLETSISFKNGPPKELFIECTSVSYTHLTLPTICSV